MKYTKLSHTDIEVSKLCLGTMNWGQQNTEEEAHVQLDMAMEAGINFIDTAEMYPIPPTKEKQGNTEKILGSWLKKRGKRNDLIITSKVSSRNQAALMGTRNASQGLSEKNIQEAIDGSLSRLGVDYIDLYQVHTPDRKTNNFGVRGYAVHRPEEDHVPIAETLSALAGLVKSGKVRHIGVSNETPWGLSEYLRVAREENMPKIITVQNQYSLINRTYEIGMSEFSFREGIGLLAYSPLSKGVLSGKYLGGARPEGTRFALFLRDIERYNPDHAQGAIQAYIDLAKKYDLDPSVMALAFVNSRPFVNANIIGARTPEQFKADVGSIDVELPAELLAEIDHLYTVMPDVTA